MLRDRSHTVRRARRSDRPPHYQRPSRPSQLDPFKDEIHELLRKDAKLSGVRVRELIVPLGFRGGSARSRNKAMPGLVRGDWVRVVSHPDEHGALGLP